MFSYSQKQYTKDLIDKVWAKGKVIPNFDPNRYRQDIAGAWIEYSKYGDTSNELGFGWEIDHRKPASLGGETVISNLQPLQWANNRSKCDNYPQWSSVVTSEGLTNVKEGRGHNEE